MAADQQKERPIVLFLGAGFSADAGYPLVRNFGAHEGARHEALLKHAHARRESPEYRLAAPMLVEAAETFRRFQALCRAAHTVSDDEANNLETVFGIAEALSEAGFQELVLDDQPCSLKYVIRNIQLWLWKVYQQLPLLNPNVGDRANLTYERLFGVIRDLEIAGQLGVITTNYDILFEYLSWRRGMPCYYPFSDARPIPAGRDVFQAKSYVRMTKPHQPLYLPGGGQFYLSPGDAPLTSIAGVVAPEDGPPFNESPVVAKLHGSVNFFQNPEADDPKALYISHDLASAGDHIGKSRIPTERPAILAVDAIWSIHARFGDSFTPAIIPPTYAKLTGADWLRSVWSQAVIWLREAEVVVFVGYSLPESDGFIRAMINGAMLQRSSGPKVFVINPEEQDHRKFKDLFGDLYVDVDRLRLCDVSEQKWKSILSVE